MSIKEKKINISSDSREVIIEANNLGVSYLSGRKDDYKSHVFNYLRNKKESASKEKEAFWPLRNVNFKGYKGEVLGIIGSNGSGKTTLCKLISGILQPDEGQLTVNGKVSALFSLGMGFNKELSGRENVYLNGMMLGIEKNKIDEYIGEICKFSGIGEFIDRPMKYYSSGMKARLGFSVAAYLEPEILILDEALNTGDAEFSQKAADKIKQLVTKAKMVLIVTHSLKYAKKNCDRLIWLDKGVIREIGNPKDVIERYLESIPVKSPKPKPKRLELAQTESEVRDTTAIKLNQISVTYEMKNEKFNALNDVSFTINEGEVVGIIGHNGAGKSTLCKLFTRILTPDQGNIVINGETTALLGYGTGFNAQLTGADNIYLNGMLLGIPKKDVNNNYANIVEFSELGDFINKPVKEYSSGMKARLGFSIAATLKPDIFIIDEALSTGDMAFKQKASEKIQEMMEQAKAVIIVSHSMGFVEKVCTRAIWMERGKVRFDGNSKEAVQLYREEVKRKKNKN
ncbi:ABC transporter ATP-binding protein [Bacillus alkalicellulosilyticus]|uniref:ABC transporter ATP-binding protein n=1 Tax=Alkalihalobacterium alkalicellulosilyticum TaxID=1912214 RepID=UPI0009986BB5|nr:ATP-binding cassette domain-containing protein [Bacillus alkalicellulosilyticus]